MPQTSYLVEKRIHITFAKVYLEPGDMLSFVPENKNSLTVYRKGKIHATFTWTQVGINGLLTGGIIVPTPTEESTSESDAPETGELTAKVPAEVKPEVSEKGEVIPPAKSEVTEPVISESTPEATSTTESDTAATEGADATGEPEPENSHPGDITDETITEPPPAEGAKESAEGEDSSSSSNEETSETSGEELDDVDPDDEVEDDITTFTKKDLAIWGKKNGYEVDERLGQAKLLASIQVQIAERSAKGADPTDAETPSVADTTI